MGNQRLEARGIALEPVHHVPTERSASRRHSLGVNVGERFQVLDTLHQVLKAFAAPVATDLIDKLLPKTGATARIGQGDDIPLRCPYFRTPAIAPAILPRALWSAVNEVSQG